MKSPRWLFWTLVALAALIVIVGQVWVTYRVFTSRYPGGNDLYPRWVGGCALLHEGLSPYSETVTLRAQEGLLGRPARPGEDQATFLYPLYSLLFFWPLCFTDNYPLARAVWMWGLLTALMGATALWMRVIGWRPRSTLWVFTLVWVALLYHNFRAVILGQFAVFVLLALVVALWAMQQGRDGWAGVCLALATVKPPLVYLAIPWILLWAAGQRRWRLWLSFGASMAVLLVGSMILLPSWIPDFVRQAIAYPSYTVYGSLTWMIVRYALGLGRVAEIVVLMALAVLVLVLGWRLWRGTWEQMVWMLGLLLLLTNFFTSRIATTNYLTLVPWALWGFCWVQRTWRRGVWIVAVLEIVSAVGLWALFLATIEGNFERAPVYFPFPAAILLMLVWLWGRMRRQRSDVRD